MFGILGDIATIVTAPIKIAHDTTRIVTKPLADAVEAVVDEVEEISKDITDDK
jgi:hypothetical protein